MQLILDWKSSRLLLEQSFPALRVLIKCRLLAKNIATSVSELPTFHEIIYDCVSSVVKSKLEKTQVFWNKIEA